MTVSSTTRRAGPYPGNGVATSFPFSFKVYAKYDISVVFANSLGVESTLVLDSDYSVTLNANQDTTPGGTITYPITGSPMLSTQALAIVGGLDYAQTTALPNGGAYNASIVERALDRIVILTQQLRETVNRGVQLAFTTAANVSSRLPAPRGGSVLGWAADGLSLTNFDAAGLGVSVSYAAWQTQTFNGTGSQTAFVLTNDAGVASNCDVVVGGVAQTPDINFSYDSLTKTITFLTGAPPAGTNNVVVRYGQALPQGTVASTSITDSTATGRAVLTAASQAAARTAVGAAAPGANNDITALLNPTGIRLPTRVDVASAATVVLTGTPDDVRITGTTTITAFTVAAGEVVRVTFGGSLTLTNNASIVTQTGANIVTQAGDTCMLRATAANVVEVLGYVPVVLNQQATRSMVELDGPNGYGSTNTVIPRFTTVVANQGTDITYADSATLGASFTINVAGVYAITYTRDSVSGARGGVSRNSSQLTTSIGSITSSTCLSQFYLEGSNRSEGCSWTGYLAAGTVIRPHCDAIAFGTLKNGFTISRAS